jgi:bacillithiol synthase
LLAPDILVRPLSGSKLVDDYRSGGPALEPFFFGFPHDKGVFQRKLDEVRSRFSSERRAAMAEFIRPTSPGAAARLDRVISEGGVFVTTGQQPGLFTGPVLTVYKIFSALQLAQVLEDELATPVAALFWVASDDHDWEESNHANVLDLQNRLRRVALTRPADAAPVSMAHQPLGPALEGAFDELRQALPETEFSDPLFELLRGAYSPGRTVAEAFEELVVRLFAEFDLLVVDGGHHTVKELSAEVMRRELEQSEAHARALREQADQLEAAGYRVQVPIAPGAANLFYEDASGRDRLVREEGGWKLRRSGRQLKDAELLSSLSSDPARFSANVLLRPVVESTVFPTVAYVSGPGELAYFAQIQSLFRSHGLEMPLVYPRSSATLVERKVAKVLDKLGMGVEAFQAPVHELAGRVVRDELPEDVARAIAGLRGDLADGYGRLAERVQAIDPTLAGPIAGARTGSVSQLDDIEKKIIKHLKERNSTVIAQLDKAAANLYPGGKPQERVLNVFSYLFRYGPGLVPSIAESFDVAPSAERVV